MRQTLRTRRLYPGLRPHNILRHIRPEIYVLNLVPRRRRVGIIIKIIAFYLNTQYLMVRVLNYFIKGLKKKHVSLRIQRYIKHTLYTFFIISTVRWYIIKQLISSLKMTVYTIYLPVISKYLASSSNRSMSVKLSGNDSFEFLMKLRICLNILPSLSMK